METDTWPWDDDGFVWPWERWLWSRTVYNDEAVGESIASYTVDHLQSVALLFDEAGHEREGSVDFGRSGFEGRGDVGGLVPSTTPEGSPARFDIIIPPTPCLPGGLRPIDLLVQPTHPSGLLGASPAPIRFKHFGNFSVEESDEEEGDGRLI